MVELDKAQLVKLKWKHRERKIELSQAQLSIEQSSTEKQERAEPSSTLETNKNIHEVTLKDIKKVLNVPFVAHCATSKLEDSTLQDISCDVETGPIDWWSIKTSLIAMGKV